MQFVIFLLCFLAVRAQLFLQLSGPETLPSIPLPLDNQDHPTELCTDSHPITVRCDETVGGSTRATFFVNGARFHMEFYKDYYIGRNKDNVSWPWDHPQGLTKVECRLDNKERFTTFIVFKCEPSIDSSPEASIAPSYMYEPIANPVVIEQEPKGVTSTTSAIPSPSTLPTVSVATTASEKAGRSTAPTASAMSTALSTSSSLNDESHTPSPSATVSVSIIPSMSAYASSSVAFTPVLTIPASPTSPSPTTSPIPTSSPSSTPVSAVDLPTVIQRSCVVIDATKTYSGTYAKGWELDNEGGVVYNKWKKALTLSQAGKSVLGYRFSVPVEGHFAFVLDSRSRQWTEYNDVYVRLLPDGFRFMKNGVFNRGVQATGWHKVFQNDYGRSFSTKSISHNAHSISTASILVPGAQYTIELSGRSNKFTVHRIVMFPCEDTECQQSSDFWVESINRCVS